MGHIELNGIQTPPARIWFEKRNPIIPGSNWQYFGPFGSGLQLPELILPFLTPPCEPRLVVWEVSDFLTDTQGAPSLVVRIEKRQKSALNPLAWDSYWIQLTIAGVASDFFREYVQFQELDYTRYLNAITNLSWVWGGLNPFQIVTSTEAWPIAWDRSEPGPPFIPGL